MVDRLTVWWSPNTKGLKILTKYLKNTTFGVSITIADNSFQISDVLSLIYLKKNYSLLGPILSKRVLYMSVFLSRPTPTSVYITLCFPPLQPSNCNTVTHQPNKYKNLSQQKHIHTFQKLHTNNVCNPLLLTIKSLSHTLTQHHTVTFKVETLSCFILLSAWLCGLCFCPDWVKYDEWLQIIFRYQVFWGQYIHHVTLCFTCRL